MNIPADVVATKVPAFTVIPGGLADRASRAVQHTVASNPQAAVIAGAATAACLGTLALAYLGWKFGPTVGRGLGTGLRASRVWLADVIRPSAEQDLKEVITRRRKPDDGKEPAAA